MDYLPWLHAGHEVRTRLDQLSLISWAVIGLAVGTVVVSWGRLIAWLRAPDASGPALVSWSAEAGVCQFEVRNTAEQQWSVETTGGTFALEANPGRRMMLRGAIPDSARAIALLSSSGVRLPL